MASGSVSAAAGEDDDEEAAAAVAVDTAGVGRPG